MKRTSLPPRKKPLKRTAIKRVPKGAATIEKMLGEGLISKASCLQRKQKPIRKRRPKKPGEQTQIELFKEIWDERPHVSEISGIDLIEMPDDWTDRDTVRAWVSQFSHLLNKGHYKKYKSVKRNIVLKALAEHAEWHRFGPGVLAFDPLWKKTCDLYYELRDEANNVNQNQ